MAEVILAGAESYPDPPRLNFDASVYDICAAALAWDSGERWHKLAAEERDTYRRKARMVIALWRADGAG
jgi:hypothetical protein